MTRFHLLTLYYASTNRVRIIELIVAKMKDVTRSGTRVKSMNTTFSMVVELSYAPTAPSMRATSLRENKMVEAAGSWKMVSVIRANGKMKTDMALVRSNMQMATSTKAFITWTRGMPLESMKWRTVNATKVNTTMARRVATGSTLGPMVINTRVNGHVIYSMALVSCRRWVKMAA